jgi:hypothetical protein
LTKEKTELPEIPTVSGGCFSGREEGDVMGWKFYWEGIVEVEDQAAPTKGPPVSQGGNPAALGDQGREVGQ